MSIMITPEAGSSESFKRLSFSTEVLPVDGRIELWERHNSEALLPLDIRTLDEQPMTASQTNLVLPSMRLAGVAGTSQIVERNESFIRANPTGVVAVFFALEGDAFFVHRGGMLTLHPGQAVVYHGDRPFTRGFPKGLRELVLTIPEAQFTEAFGVPEGRLPFVFDFGRSASPGGRTLAGLLAETLGLRSGQGSERSLQIEELQERMLTLLQNVITGSLSHEGSLVEVAKDVIENRFSDSRLSVAEIAAGVGISERHLARAFAQEGLTIGGYLRWRRVAVAQMMLREPRYAGISVGEIGVRCGFSSSSSFTRAFREEVGQTPSVWRKEPWN